MIEKQKLIEIVGGANVSDEAGTLDAYSKDMSFVNQTRPVYVVKPHTAGEVKELVAAANETLTPLVPVSSGPPHFRGDTVPSTGGAVVVDLSEMKKIVFVDRPRRVAMVEPGVTFGELIPAAEKEGIRLNMPLLPRATKSVIGSMLEREPVVMPAYQWDISDPVACLEVIFGNGEDFRTGQAAGPGTVEEQWAVGGVQKAPYGPHVAAWHRLVQGAQGTMGIVTWASLRCELLPSLEEPFVVGSAQLDPLLEMADWLIRLRMVTECFVLSGTDSGGHVRGAVARGLPAPQGRLAALDPLLHGGRLRVLPRGEGERQHQGHHRPQPGAWGWRLRNLPAASPPSDILKAVQRPSAEPYWKLRYKGACEDVFFLATIDKLESLVGIMDGLAAKAGYPVADLGVYIQPDGAGHELPLRVQPVLRSRRPGRDAAGPRPCRRCHQDPHGQRRFLLEALR